MSVNAWALNDWKNYYGATPYLNDSATKLNPPFWEHLGWVIDQAADRGLFILLVYGSPGRTDNRVAITQTPAEAYAYGNALGSLYRDKPNLIWANGIDVNPDDAKRVSPMGMAGWHAMAEGVADGVNGVQKFDGQADWTSTLMTYHPRGGSSFVHMVSRCPVAGLQRSANRLAGQHAAENDRRRLREEADETGHGHRALVRAVHVENAAGRRLGGSVAGLPVGLCRRVWAHLRAL